MAAQSACIPLSSPHLRGFRIGKVRYFGALTDGHIRRNVALQRSRLPSPRPADAQRSMISPLEIRGLRQRSGISPVTATSTPLCDEVAGEEIRE